jgi:hypothetical protein
MAMRNNDNCLALSQKSYTSSWIMYTMAMRLGALQQAFAGESSYTDALPDLPVQLLPGAAVLAQPLPQPMCMLPQQPLMQRAQHQQQQAVPFSSPEHSQESAASLRAPQVH